MYCSDNWVYSGEKDEVCIWVGYAKQVLCQVVKCYELKRKQSEEVEYQHAGFVDSVAREVLIWAGLIEERELSHLEQQAHGGILAGVGSRQVIGGLRVQGGSQGLSWRAW